MGAAALRVEYHRPALYPAQQRAIFDAYDCNGELARYAVIEASTKAGKTAGCMAWLVEAAMLAPTPHRNYWWVAPVYTQAKIAYRRIKQGLTPGSFKSNDTDMAITLVHSRAVLWFKSAEKPDNLYGEDVYAAVVDEASRCREDAWIALRSTLTATRGPVRIIGNVKGRANWHYRLARRAESGEPGFAYSKLTAYDAVAGGVIDIEEVEDAKRLLPEQVFNELYLAIPSDDQGNPFGQLFIPQNIRPLSGLPPVAIGIDLAKSHDWTVIVGLDRFGQVCGFERFQQSWDETEKTILNIIGQVPTLIDSTGVGDPIVERLVAKRPMVSGYKFSQSTKQQLMEGLALAIQQGTVWYPDGPIVRELEVFEYRYTRTGVVYTAPEGLHDDCVVALALALRQHRLAVPEYALIQPDGVTRVSPWVGGTNAPDDDEYR